MTAPTTPSPRTMALLGRRRCTVHQPPTDTIVSISATYDPTVDTDQTLRQTRDRLVEAVRNSTWYQQRATRPDDPLAHLVSDLAELNDDDLACGWGPLVSALCLIADADTGVLDDPSHI